ncbi:alcohol dehydrogenase-like [Phymastichus coffea]|uniref:alcohol dehydrogenase-like n=1 Tax=Phymastichus coffea TaxID=108790 RepID=UPI00273CE07F|nr:alcohol dehydrogenase-like [Phymastichus coffea]
MDIKNKVAIVTGGTGGIGFATVQALLKNGVKHVAIFDVEATRNRAASQLQKIAVEFGKDRASYVVCDVTNPKQIEDSYNEVVKSQKGVDLLINNAGILSDTHANLMIDINLKGLVNCTLTAIERMGKHNKGKGGTIVNVASTAGLYPFPALPIYNATKFGVYGFTLSLKEHYQNTGVRVVGMCPGVTQTDFLQRNWREESLKFVDDKFLDDLRNSSGVIQPPENVAEAIVKMIKEAEPGAIWLSEENKPPCAIKEAPHYQSRKMLLK